MVPKRVHNSNGRANLLRLQAEALLLGLVLLSKPVSTDKGRLAVARFAEVREGYVLVGRIVAGPHVQIHR